MSLLLLNLDKKTLRLESCAILSKKLGFLEFASAILNALNFDAMKGSWFALRLSIKCL